MKSKLFFRHVKHNILKYTIALSAAVHLIGIIYFPSWGTVPDLLKEKVIKIKTVLEKPIKLVDKKPPEPKIKKPREIVKPKKKPEPIAPNNRQKSPMIKSAKAVTPSPAKERTPVPIHHSKQIFLPVKAIQQGSSTPHPIASLQKMAEMKFPSTITPSSRRQQTETPPVDSSNALKELEVIESFLNITQINTSSPDRHVVNSSEVPSPHPTLQKKYFTQVAMIGLSKTPRVTFSNSKGKFPRLNTKSVQIFSPASFEENISIPSPASEVNIATENKKLKINPLLLAHNIHPLNQGTPAAPTRRESFESRVVSVPKAGIKVRSPHDLDSVLSTPGQRIIPVAGGYSNPPSRTTTLMQMASIPAGFSEETISGNSQTHGNKPSGKNNSAGGTNGNSADQMGKIKKAFSSQVWTKIAQSKYYPRLARKRGFEGEPVVAFTLGGTGNLLEVSIKNPSQYKLLDEAALEAVKSASPYPPIPELLQMKTIRFKLPISFTLEEP